MGVSETATEAGAAFSLLSWKYDPAVLLCALLGSFFSFFILRNISWFGVKGELHWAVKRGIVIAGIILGAWLGGCLAAYFYLS